MPSAARPPAKIKTKQPKNLPPSGALIVSIARSWLGVPYLYGGTTRQGVDCSGLVQQVAFAAGVKNCPRTSEAQWVWCEHLSASQAGTGDLVFFTGAEIDPPPGHVGIIVTPGTMINAPYTGAVVRYDHYADGPGVNHIIGYGRMVGVTGSGSANPYVVQRSGTAGAKQAQQVVASGGIWSSIVLVAVILMMIIAFALLLMTGAIFRSPR